jgi:hypothetical protein
MKKTLERFKNVSEMSRKDKQNILGGLAAVSGVCTIKRPWGTMTVDFGDQSSGNAASGAANDLCVTLITANGGSCSYDCAYDGVG